jgi:polyhydroxyalkanoate synthase
VYKRQASDSPSAFSINNFGDNFNQFSQIFDPSSWLSSPAAQLWADQMGKMWQQGADFWTSSISNFASAAGGPQQGDAREWLAKDRRFADEQWHQHPAFVLLRQTYGFLSEQLLSAATRLDGLDAATKAKLEFAARSISDALSPTNIAITNPEVMKRAVESGGESLLIGLQNMLNDLARGQLTHVDRSAFELGVNIAATSGKVVHETPLYQLIHYAPTTKKLLATPLLIFPPWINRFYILDLNPQKSFVKWALDQGISVFMVSWKSADESMADVTWDDYVSAQVDAIDAVRATLNVPSVHCIGYCVAGTTMAATLAMLAAKGEADRVQSATFFTAQVDFELAGDLKIFVDDQSLKLLEQLSAGGYLDGRYIAATFNALRSRDLIWNYVVNHYLLGQDYPAFDLLYWNGDVTNLPAKWHQQYLHDLYHRNLLVQPDALTICDTPINLSRITTPAFIQAGREDHIAPLASVWRIMDHLAGPKEFIIAGSGHIAGVVNPPSAQKYQYWTGDSGAATLDEFDASATETKGSWWPHWLQWLRAQNGDMVDAKGARIPGKGKKKPIEDAPGRYVKMP